MLFFFFFFHNFLLLIFIIFIIFFYIEKMYTISQNFGVIKIFYVSEKSRIKSGSCSKVKTVILWNIAYYYNKKILNYIYCIY